MSETGTEQGEISLHWREMWNSVASENQTRKEIMAWNIDKLRKLKRNLEYDVAACEALINSLSEDNPKMKGTKKGACDMADEREANIDVVINVKEVEEKDDKACRLREAWQGPEDLLEDVCTVLKPHDEETAVDAAKRCAAMAAKLPKAQKKAARWKFAAEHWCYLMHNAKDAEKRAKRWHEELFQLVKKHESLQKNWRRKATRIASALGTRDGETLVAAAERVAAQTCPPGYADLIRRVQEAETEGRKWKERAESFMADFYRPALAAAGVSEALSWEGAAKQVIAKLQPKPHEAPPEAFGHCPTCNCEMIETTLKTSKVREFMCPFCEKETQP